MAKAASPYRTLYFRDPADYARIQAKAKDLGMSASEFVRRAALGELPATLGGASAERARQLEEEAKYWRERFEKMAALAQDTQAEVLQLRAELRTRAIAPGGEGAPDVGATALAPRLIVVFTSLRSADGKYRVWTETELLDEMGLDARRDAGAPDRLRSALAMLYRSNLVEPQRNGWRYRD